jgi:hypothetical protein
VEGRYFTRALFSSSCPVLLLLNGTGCYVVGPVASDIFDPSDGGVDVHAEKVGQDGGAGWMGNLRSFGLRERASTPNESCCASALLVIDMPLLQHADERLFGYDAQNGCVGAHVDPLDWRNDLSALLIGGRYRPHHRVTTVWADRSRSGGTAGPWPCRLALDVRAWCRGLG